MSTYSIQIFDNFKKYLKRLYFTQQKTEKLCSQQRISIRDIEQVYRGLFLDAVATFEECIETLFIGLSTGRIRLRSTSRVSKVSLKNTSTARPIITGGNYYNWFPYHRTKKKAGYFFKNGHPFTVLSRRDMDLIKRITIIRNAIAHKSDFAKKKFENTIIGSTSILPREKKVAAYLRGRYSFSSINTRYEDLITQMAYIIEKICDN